jgi:K+-transporting ATPase c subunit
MTINELLKNPVEELEKMTDEQLTEHLKHYFIHTRPEEVKKEKESGSQNRSVTNKFIDAEKQQKIERARQIAAQLGIKI